MKWLQTLLRRAPRTDRNEKPDCDGPSPCSTCQDKTECGKAGCVRQREYVAPSVKTPAPEQASEAACRAALADLDPVVIEVWKLQGRTVGAMLKDRDDHIAELEQRLEDADGVQPSAPLTFTDGWQNLVCYLIDHAEGERITEEALHRWAAEFLRSPRYANAPGVRVPLGSWELSTTPGLGLWRHNPILKMTAAEQRAWNERAGYECPGTDGVRGNVGGRSE